MIRLTVLLFSILDCVDHFSQALNEEDWYSVQTIGGVAGWVELRDHKWASRLDLTDEHLAFVNQSLPFQFPFYGEDFSNIKITTQGFIALSEVIGTTQYIGPLVANFKPLPSSSPTQDIRVLYNSDSAIIQWGRMLLDKQSEAGEFNFQLHLSASGAIKMLYQSVPIPINQISAEDHFVTVGISGGHPMGRTIPLPYSTISIPNVESNTTLILLPLATCIDHKDCASCIRWSSMCKWCESAQQCSTGRDKYKANWKQNGCGVARSSTRSCSSLSYASRFASSATTPFHSTFSSQHKSPSRPSTALPSTFPLTQPHTVKTDKPTKDNKPASEPPRGTIEPPHDTTKPSRTQPPPGGTAPQGNLPLIYLILIVASSCSLVLVLAAFAILCWHKRRLSRSPHTLQPETNNLLSNGSSGHSDTNGVKC